MPPKPKFTKEEVISAAFEVMLNEGYDNISMRSIAKKLKTTGTPLFTLFSSILEIKEEVFEKGKRMFIEHLKESLKYRPAFKQFGIYYIGFAVDNPNVFEMLFNKKLIESPIVIREVLREVIDPLVPEIMQSFELTKDEALELFNIVMLQTSGIAIFINSGFYHESMEKIASLLSKICISNVMLIKARNGTINLEKAKELARATERMPEKLTK